MKNKEEPETNKSELAEKIVGKRKPIKGIIFDQPAELGYCCPVCKNINTDGKDFIDERLHWSEYNSFLWCSICNRDYPSALCQPNIDKAIETFLWAVVDGKRLAIKTNNEKERIICSANHYLDGKEHIHSPVNIKTGFVVCGHRHHNCISTFAQMVGFPYSDESQKLQNTEIQGFLTNKNRFVDRLEGAEIALKAGQIDKPVISKIGLFSEDIY